MRRPQPLASNLNVVPGVNTPNLVAVKVGAGGQVCLYTQSGGHLIADISGYFPAVGDFLSLSPERLLDTRPGSAVGYTGLKAGPGAVVALQVTGVGAVAGTNVGVSGRLECDRDGGVGGRVRDCVAMRRAATTGLQPQRRAGREHAELGGGQSGRRWTGCLYTQSGGHLIADISGYW